MAFAMVGRAGFHINRQFAASHLSRFGAFFFVLFNCKQKKKVQTRREATKPTAEGETS